MMTGNLDVLSWRPGQSHERCERPAPGLADAVLLELDEDEGEDEDEDEDVDEDEDMCEGSGAGSESDWESGKEAILRFFLAPLQAK